MMPSGPAGIAPLLSDDPAVREFLATYTDVDAAAAHIEFLSGGVSSAVVRVKVDGNCYVIKQALPRLRVAVTWLSRPERSPSRRAAPRCSNGWCQGPCPRSCGLYPKPTPS